MGRVRVGFWGWSRNEWTRYPFCPIELHACMFAVQTTNNIHLKCHIMLCNVVVFQQFLKAARNACQKKRISLQEKVIKLLTGESKLLCCYNL